MNDQKINAVVVHSQSKQAWNVVNKELGGKYKLARIPYFFEYEKDIAQDHAEFICWCFNNAADLHVNNTYQHFKNTTKKQ